MGPWSMILVCVLCYHVIINRSLSDIEIPLCAQPINTTSADVASNSDSSDDSAMLRAVHVLKKSPQKSALSPTNRTKEVSFRVVFNDTLNIHEYRDQQLMERFTAPIRDANRVTAVYQKSAVDSMIAQYNSHHDHQFRILEESQYRMKVIGLWFAFMILVLLLAMAGFSLWYYQMQNL